MSEGGSGGLKPGVAGFGGPAKAGLGWDFFPGRAGWASADGVEMSSALLIQLFSCSHVWLLA